VPKSKSQKAKKGSLKIAKRAPRANDFAAWTARLQALLDDREDEGSTSSGVRPRDRPDNMFNMAAYSYYRRLKRKKLVDALRAYIEERDGTRWAGPKETPAFWVLRLVAKDYETNADRQSRKRLAAALELAAVNRVRPEVLLGFLYEVGPIGTIEKDAAANVKYPWAKYYRKPKW
jgi:hypothetical protein